MSAALIHFINKDVLQEVEYTASGTFTVPKGVYKLFILAAGGGGGGGGGGANINGSGTDGFSGGQAGHGATPVWIAIDVIPGDVLTITCGAGGPGGQGGQTSGSNGADGSDGAMTTITGTGVNLKFPGAIGGLGYGGAAVVAESPIAPDEFSNEFLPLYLVSGTPGGGSQNTGSSSNGPDGHPGKTNCFQNEAALPGAGGPDQASGSSRGGGAGGGSGGASIDPGGAGGHGAGGNDRGYDATAAVRASNLTTITMSNTRNYSNDNFNVGEYVRVSGFDASFNGLRQIVEIPNNLSIVVSDPGSNATSVAVAGVIKPNPNDSTEVTGAGRGVDGTRGSGGGGGGGAGGYDGSFVRGGDGAKGGDGAVKIYYSNPA